MCYEEIACPSCSSPNIKKNGRTTDRKQRFQCKGCFRQLLTDYTNLGCLPEVRWLVIVLTLNGCDIRDIVRVLLISHTTILKTLLAEAAAVDEPSVPGRIEMLELDEFWSFVGSKRRPRWTWYAIDRQRRRVVAFVNGRRTDESGRELCRKLARARVNTYRTDKWPTYARCLLRCRHHTSKEGTCRIERHHLNFRTRIKRLQRRTICYSRSPELHDAVIKLFIHYSNSKHHHF
jgi:insertion element IS1 protein InsB